MTSGNGTLEGKVAIITGGGTGLGKCMALIMAGEGADIVVAARRVEAIEQTAKEVRELGCRGLAIATDVTDSGQVNRMVEQTLAEMGQIDILVNNAGIVRGQQRKPIWEIADEDWHLGIDTNLTGCLYCTRAVSKYFLDRKKGKVINIASGNGLRGGRGDFMYGTAKAAVIQLTRVFATTWAQENIQVNCIAPGFIDVGHLQLVPRTYSGLRRSEFIPVGRLGIPEDIGYLGLFLASDASDYITGALFTNDGGGMAGGITPTGFAQIIPLKEE